VFRVYAGRIITAMENMQSFRNISVSYFPSKTRGQHASTFALNSTDTDISIALLILGTYP